MSVLNGRCDLRSGSVLATFIAKISSCTKTTTGLRFNVRPFIYRKRKSSWQWTDLKSKTTRKCPLLCLFYELRPISLNCSVVSLKLYMSCQNGAKYDGSLLRYSSRIWHVLKLCTHPWCLTFNQFPFIYTLLLYKKTKEVYVARPFNYHEHQ